MHELELAHAQLQRMRGMTRYYHGRFFADTRFVVIAVLLLFVVGFWEIPEAFLLIPVVALIGANQTAFDASYLFMARRYAAALEGFLNDAMRQKVLIGSELEDRYLVPLRGKNVVGVAFGGGFSWFGWMTVLYTMLGVIASVAGVVLGWETLNGWGVVAYSSTMGVLTVSSLVVGWWWFMAGTGQRRLDEVVAASFPVSPVSARA